MQTNLDYSTDQIPYTLEVINDDSSGLNSRKRSMSEYPTNLRDSLQSHALFCSAPESLIEELAHNMKSRVYLPGDVVIKEGESGSAMFFIIKGIVQIYSDATETILAELTAGRFFGEIGLLFGIPRTANAISKSKCLVAILGQHQFKDILNHYPEIYKNILDEGRARYLERDSKFRKDYEVSKNEEELKRLLRTFSFLSSIDDTELSNLISFALFKVLNPDDLLFHDHTNSQVLFIVEGKVEVLSNDLSQSNKLQTGDYYHLNDLSDESNNYALKFVKANQKSKILLVPSGLVSPYISDVQNIIRIEDLKLSSENNFTTTIAKEKKSFENIFKKENSNEAIDSSEQKEVIPEESIFSFQNPDCASLISTASEKRRPSVAVWADPSLASIAESKNERRHKQTYFEDQFLDNAEHDKSTQDFTFNGLDGDLMVRILSFLDIKCLMTVQRVCKSWYKICKDERLATKIDLSPFHKCINDEKLEKIVKFSNRRLKTLILRDCWHVTNNGIALAASYMPNVSHIDLKSCWDISIPGIRFLTSKCEYLEILDFGNCRKIDDNCIELIVGTGSSLSQLSLSYCKSLTDETMKHLTRASETLVSLNVQRCTSITDAGFVNNMREDKPWYSLLELNISDCSFLTSASIKAIGMSAPFLRGLNLSFCCNLNETAMSYLAAYCTNLESLDLSYCGNAVSDSALNLVVSNLKQLQKLSIRGCVKVTLLALFVLKEKGHNLQVVNASSCKNISEESIESIKKEVPWIWMVNESLDSVDCSNHSRRFTC